MASSIVASVSLVYGISFTGLLIDSDILLVFGSIYCLGGSLGRFKNRLIYYLIAVTTLKGMPIFKNYASVRSLIDYGVSYQFFFILL
jgi:hypothetical protein